MESKSKLIFQYICISLALQNGCTIFRAVAQKSSIANPNLKKIIRLEWIRDKKEHKQSLTFSHFFSIQNISLRGLLQGNGEYCQSHAIEKADSEAIPQEKWG